VRQSIATQAVNVGGGTHSFMHNAVAPYCAIVLLLTCSICGELKAQQASQASLPDAPATSLTFASNTQLSSASNQSPSIEGVTLQQSGIDLQQNGEQTR
jgi:hypothetical protein